MPGLNICLDGDNCWPDLRESGFAKGEIVGIALLANGMVSGAPSVTFRAKLEDGTTALVETSFALLEAGVRTMRERIDAESGVETWTPSRIGTPQSKEEYEQRFAQNAHASGYGIQNVKQHMPCPFCASPEWLVAGLLELEATSSKETVCNECGRGARTIYHHEGRGDLSFEIVQTRGDDAPAWLPKMRRVEP